MLVNCRYRCANSTVFQQRGPRGAKLRQLCARRERAESVGDSSGRQHAGDGRVHGAARLRDVAVVAVQWPRGRTDTTARPATPGFDRLGVPVRRDQPQRAVRTQRQRRSLRLRRTSRRSAHRKTTLLCLPVHTGWRPKTRIISLPSVNPDVSDGLLSSLVKRLR